MPISAVWHNSDGELCQYLDIGIVVRYWHIIMAEVTYPTSVASVRLLMPLAMFLLSLKSIGVL